MKFRYLALGVMALGGAAGFFWPAQADVPLPMDNPISMDGVQARHRHRRRSAARSALAGIPIRIEFSNGGQYLSGAHVVLSSSAGKTLAALDCAGPWVLFQVGPGTPRGDGKYTGGQGGSTMQCHFCRRQPRRRDRVVLDFKLPPNH